MEQHQDTLAQNGLQIVSIAMGQPKHIRRYCGRLAPSITCLANEGEAHYYAYGLKQASVREFISLDVLKAGKKAFDRGHKIGKPSGDVRMMPGSFLVDSDGAIRFTHYSQHIADHPEIDVLIRQTLHLKSKE